MTSDNDLRRAAHINAEKLVRSEAREALREKVADAIADGWDREGSILDAADAAIDVALEEAARVAMNVKTARFCDIDCTVDVITRDAIAAAIRAMKSSA